MCYRILKKGNENAWKASRGWIKTSQWKFEGKMSCWDQGGWGGGLSDMCSGATGAEHLVSNSLGQGGGKREPLCFPSAGYICRMGTWHCSDVCAAAIWKSWIDHISASVTQPQHSLLLSGLSSRYNETFWDTLSGSDVSNTAPITLWSLEIVCIESWISGHLFL